MDLLLLNGMFFLFSSAFCMYSMYKNDSIITNRWLYLLGWFLFVCTMSLAFVNLYNHFTEKGYSLFRGLIMKDNTQVSVNDYVTGGACILFSLYLFSLRKRCMEAHFLPRTFRIWIMRNFYKFKNRKPHHAYDRRQIKIDF
jgi:hypothetical protein